MSGLRILTAGESHGRQLTAIVDGCPAGLVLSAAQLDRDLRRRQQGYGRGDRQAIERDHVEILSGVRYGETTGAPITLVVANHDAANWGDTLAVDLPPLPAAAVTVPRPGHADLMGALVYGRHDLRDVIERASARETAARVAGGGIAKALLAEVGCRVVSHVVAIGAVTAAESAQPLAADTVAAADDDPLRCLDRAASERMRAAIDAAAEAGDTLGGVFEVQAQGFPAGVGSYVQGDRRLGATLAAALLTIPAIKGVEIGLGFAAAAKRGSLVHDEISLDEQGSFHRSTNRAGGIEGGISTGETILLRAAMKPIATLRSGLATVDMSSGERVTARFERSDVCAVPAAAVVAEAVIALALADALLARLGGTTVTEVVAGTAGLRRRNRRP
ncbi:MAG: chorismate synthase [Thermoleophilia bacterium]